LSKECISLRTLNEGKIYSIMKRLNEFLIAFIGLKLGKHQFEYQINKTFFDHFEYDDFENCDIKVNLVLEKKSTHLELNLKHKGTIHVPCDVTGEMFDLPIKSSIRVIVQFGEAFNNDNDELLILPHGEFQIDVSQYIYEMIVVSIPLKRVHPGIKDGTLVSPILDKLKELEVKESKKEEIKAENTDPRWDKLKNLLTDK
jgi:uncharacterized metal-binding protein YceD (DUF177 family)